MSNIYSIEQWSHLSIICYYIVGTVPSPVNPLTDTVPHQVIPQYENVDMINAEAQFFLTHNWSDQLKPVVLST